MLRLWPWELGRLRWRSHAMRVELRFRVHYTRPMSLAEILDELPRLTPEQRHQVAEKVLALEGDWIEDDDALSPEERHLVESRLAAHDRDPASALPWEDVKARLLTRFVR
jgi:putative addiction module component (TIGR02574 family)